MIIDIDFTGDEMRVLKFETTSAGFPSIEEFLASKLKRIGTAFQEKELQRVGKNVGSAYLNATMEQKAVVEELLKLPPLGE